VVPANEVKDSDGATSMVLVLEHAAHAAVQDLYHAWCVYDALLKSAVAAATATLISKDVPVLLSECFPYWKPVPLIGSDIMRSALREYKELFIDVVRSWWVNAVLSPETLRRCEGYITQRLHLEEERLRSTMGDVQQPRGHYTPSAVQNVISIIAGRPMDPAEDPSQGSVDAAVAGLQSVSGARLVELFVDELYNKNRGQHCCTHCGAYFENPSAKADHTRYHFYLRSVDRKLKFTRLRFVSGAEFVAHNADPLDGNFVKPFGPLSASGSVQVRGNATGRQLA
jgi:hypothetical protein